MRAALLTVLLIVGCSKKETKDEAAGAKQEPAPEAKQTPEDKAGELAAKPPAPPAEDKPAEPPAAQPAPPSATVDCNAFLTAEDVARACGGSKVDVTEYTSPAKHPAAVCSRKMTEPGKKFPIAQLHFMVFADKAAADGWVKLDRTDDAKDLAGVGDLAWTRVKERPQLESTDYDVGVRKGNAVLKLSMTQGRLVKKVPCTIDQLAELAKIVAPRMP